MEGDSSSDSVQLSPKGFFCGLLSVHFAIGDEEANEAWHLLEAFCVKRLQQNDPEATYPCLVFDGEGGDIIGAERIE